MAFPPLKKTDIREFLDLAKSVPVADVRSPSEFAMGHIPGAVNIPLFNDREREAVGKKFNKNGREKAILEGLELTGPAMHLKMEEALKTAREGKIMVYCWRGGMRSEAMAWLFSLGDLSVEVLEGGYKSYRRHILSSLSGRRKTIILGGMTGSTKTLILDRIKLLGNQTIDLEAIANHKGSAFGALGMKEQPSSEQFANLLFDQWKNIDENHPVWLEDESINIGKVFMPDDFYNNMQESPTLVLLMDSDKRVSRLAEEYSGYPVEYLKESINRISRRLGGENAGKAIRALEEGNFAVSIDILLKYYDKAYMYGIGKKKSKQIIYISTDTDNIEENALKLLEESGKITW